MKHKRRIVLATGFISVLATWLLLSLLLSPSPVDALIKWELDRKFTALLGSQEIPESRFEVIFCGTGSPQYHPDRGQPCLGIVAGGRFLLFDAGQGTAQQLNAVSAPFHRLDTVFLTHLHSDHMSGLGETLHNGWLYGRQESIEVVGPPGTAKLLQGYQQVYDADVEERKLVAGEDHFKSGSAIGQAREAIIDSDAAVIVYDKDGVVVKAFHVDHPQWSHAYGYRIEFRDKAVVVSGDTRYAPAIAHHAQDADMLIHEALNTKLLSLAGEVLATQNIDFNPEHLQRMAAVHTPTEQVAQIAAAANVKTLVLSHLIPAIPANSVSEQFFARGISDTFDGELIVARDGMRITLVE